MASFMVALMLITVLSAVVTVNAININIKPTNVINEIEKFSCNMDIFNPTDDVFIKHDNPDDTGNHPYISIRNEYGFDAYPGFAWDELIKFDISSIPPGTNIIHATLNLYYWSYEGRNPAGRLLTLYRALSDWDENIVSWNTQPSYAQQPSSFIPIPFGFGWVACDVTSDVQDFVDGLEVNYGWKITDEDNWGRQDIPTPIFRSKEYGSQTPFLEVEDLSTPSNPPYKPTIDGPTKGTVGLSYVFNATTTDPEGDKIFYKFDWGDDTHSSWVGPYNSGSTANESHIWNLHGKFIVKVKASDIHGAVSSWSDPLIITIRKDKALANSFFLRFLERYPLLQKMLSYLI